MSIGVLQHHDVTWTPALPEWKQVGLFGFHMATYLKLFLAWEDQFWDDNQYTVYVDPANRGYYKYVDVLGLPKFEVLLV